MSRELYKKQTWANLPDESTPISAERLTHLEEGIYQNSEDKALKELYGDNHISLGRKANTTTGNNSIATGYDAEASGSYSCAEGMRTVASGSYSHAEGSGTKAEGFCSHAEGNNTTAKGGDEGGSHAEGVSTIADYTSHAEGYNTTATFMSHTEGWKTTAKNYAHAEGYNTTAENMSHAEGNDTTASGRYSHAEGYMTVANAMFAHAEGNETEASGQASHSEGLSCVASGIGCHAEGYQTTAKDTFTHAEGYETVSGETGSHAEGGYANANASFCHVEGYHTKASSDYQHVQGKYNVEDTENTYAHIVGNGTADNARSNAHTIDWEGNAWFAGDVANGNGVSLDGLRTRIDEMETGDTSGTTDYTELENKPQINGVELLGNKTTSDLGINAKSIGADIAGSASTALSDAKEYTNAKIDDLVNGAPSTLDTLKEISEALEESGEAVEAINQAIGNKLDKAGDSKDNTVTFTQESERSNITSNEKHSTIFGKIAKWFADLKTVAFSGSYNDLSNKPAIPTKVSELKNDSGYATGEELKKTTELAALNKQTLGYGKKNLLKGDFPSKTVSGVTFTVNSNKSITAKGTATVNTSVYNSGLILEKGTYILSGCPKGGTAKTYRLAINNIDVTPELSLGFDYGEGFKFTLTEKIKCRVYVDVRSGYTANNLTFYPMIRSADIEDDTYEPYVDDVDTRLDKIDNSILNTLEEIEANTDPDMIASALAVKELYNLVKNK